VEGLQAVFSLDGFNEVMTTLTLLSPASTQGSRFSRFRQDGLLFIIALYWTLSANGLFITDCP